MKKQLLILFALIFISTSSYSQISVTNSADEPVWVAVVTYKNTKNFKGWVSSGWFKIVPGETANCGGHLYDGDNTYYVHAHTSNYESVWGSEASFAVNKVDAFEIENADKEYVLNGENIERVNFIKKFEHIGVFEMYKASVNLTN